MEVRTIGFTKKTAAQFFGTLKTAKVECLIDVRLNNVSQLAGFAKRDDLAYFLREICGAGYRHELLLAPTQDMLDRYKKHGGSWATYEEEFINLMAQRRIEETLDPSVFDQRAVLLCSEPTPQRCHRRLVVEYLSSHWPDLIAVHL